MAADDWYLLVHQVPARPLYLRARILRRLQDAGAISIKKAVYALPREPWALEVFRAIAAELRAAGATALLCEARLQDPDDRRLLSEAAEASQRAAHQRLARPLRARLGAADGRKARARTAEAPRRDPRVARAARRRLAAIERAGRFDETGAAEIRSLLASWGAEAPEPSPARPSVAAGEWTGRRWVTRKGVLVDRVACAWLILRFVDPQARFRFVESGGGAIAGDEIGFDIPGARFTHEDGACSFERMVLGLSLTDPALRRIGEIVHDLDLKDGRYGHPETPGFERLLAGALAGEPDDRERIRRASVLFDHLYEGLRPAVRRPVVSPPGRSRPRRRP
jgi:hypothetical protein